MKYYFKLQFTILCRKLTAFGIPLAMGMYKYRAMSIPTSILVDENGIIKWIDQSEDYRIRASQDRILEALKQAFS